MQVESMENMMARLRGTGGGSQAEAVIRAADQIRQTPGMLDANNAVAALVHIAVALVGERKAGNLILSAAEQLELSA
jgi:hypothetical protein